mgnify:CR=1 FL=1
MSAVLAEGLSAREFEHILCGVVLLSRLGDVLSTYAVTPTLALEANPLVRKFRWPFALLSLSLCFSAYWWTGLAVAVFVSSALITTSNLSRAWSARALGERRMQQLLDEAARRTSRGAAIGWTLTAGGATLIAGALAAALCWINGEGWGYYVALGVAGYGATIALHHSLAVARLFRSAASARAIQSVDATRIDGQALEFECCFCGAPVGAALHAEIAIPTEGGGAQELRAHRACLSARVRPTIPFAD